MKFGVMKEVYVENCKNMYALAVNCLKNNINVGLNDLIVELGNVEDCIRKCNNYDELSVFLDRLNVIVDRIEVIINE